MLFHDKNRLANLIHGGITMKNQTRINKMLTVLLTLCVLFVCMAGSAMAEEPYIDLSQYSDGETIIITEACRIVGNGNEYNISLNIAADATVTFDVGTSGVKLNAPITVADGKTLHSLLQVMQSIP